MSSALPRGWAQEATPTPDDSGIAVSDGGGEEVLQSLFIPLIANAPFSLVLSTEWSRPMANGGTFTVVNTRSIKRDTAGKVYEERWLLSPKGSRMTPRMSWIQIADPLTKTEIDCNVRQKSCELFPIQVPPVKPYRPSALGARPLPNGKGVRTHEDLGISEVAGLPVHGYRDTTTLNVGVLGNDRPMVTLREFKHSEPLGINLSSVLETPQIGRQQFTVTQITTAEPEVQFFQPPQGWPIVDKRSANGAQTEAGAAPH